jgi:hypothetical protein
MTLSEIIQSAAASNVSGPWDAKHLDEIDEVTIIQSLNYLTQVRGQEVAAQSKIAVRNALFAVMFVAFGLGFFICFLCVALFFNPLRGLTEELHNAATAQGIVLTTKAPVNPEDFFDPNNGGVFLETFERQDLPLHWTRKSTSGTVTLTYPLSGVVGGRVARIAGGEEWRVYNDKFEFDPSVLYRMKVGLRMSAAPGNGATSARAMLRAGFEMYDASGAIVDTTGGTAFSLAHFFAAYNLDYGAAGVGVYQEFTGYLKGLGASPANNASNVAVPSVARNGAKYFAPMFVVNFDDGDGTPFRWVTYTLDEYRAAYQRAGGCTHVLTLTLAFPDVAAWELPPVVPRFTREADGRIVVNGAGEPQEFDPETRTFRRWQGLAYRNVFHPVNPGAVLINTPPTS